MDWLRVITVLMLVLFHSALPFAIGATWWISSDEKSLAANVLVSVLDQYHMPLLFLVAGVATWFSLGARTGKEYLAERMKRLFVPTILGGLVFVAANHYFSQQHFFYLVNPGTTEPFGSFLQHYPAILREKLLPFSAGWNPGHLWFLWYLLLFTLVFLPLFLLIRRKGNRFISWLGWLFEKRGAVFLLAVPIALVQIYPPPPVMDSWAFTFFPLFYHSLFFVYGFLLVSEPRVQEGLRKSGPIAIGGGLITMTLFMLLIFPPGGRAPLGAVYWPALGGEPGTVGHALYWTLRGINGWFWIIGLIYLAKKYLNFSNGFLRYANEAVLPFYIIHESCIIIVAFFAVQWNIGPLPEYAIVVLSALGMTVVLYELARRGNVTRVLFGMRPKQTVDADHFLRELGQQKAGLPELQLDPQLPVRSPSGRTTIGVLEASKEGSVLRMVVRLGQEHLSMEGVPQDRARVLLNQRLDRAIRDYRRNVSRRARKEGTYEVDLVVEDMPATPKGISDCRQVIARAVEAIESV